MKINLYQGVCEDLSNEDREILYLLVEIGKKNKPLIVVPKYPYTGSEVFQTESDFRKKYNSIKKNLLHEYDIKTEETHINNKDVLSSPPKMGEKSVDDKNEDLKNKKESKQKLYTREEKRNRIFMQSIKDGEKPRMKKDVNYPPLGYNCDCHPTEPYTYRLTENNTIVENHNSPEKKKFNAATVRRIRKLALALHERRKHTSTINLCLDKAIKVCEILEEASQDNSYTEKEKDSIMNLAIDSYLDTDSSIEKFLDSPIEKCLKEAIKFENRLKELSFDA